MRPPRPLLAAAALLLAGCVAVPDPALRPAGPGLEPAPVLTTHAALLERLGALGDAGVLVEPIGRSVEGRDIHLLRLGQGPFELWLAARHHGNEVTSTDAALNVLDYLQGAREPGPWAFPATLELHAHRALLLERLTFVVVPMANPDGAERDQRRNVNGQDLNRDYLLFREPESRALRDGFWRVWPDAGLDLHNEGLSPGYDYDAFYPEVPRAEAETQELSLRNQWVVVREVEASGSHAGGPNENYVTRELNDPCEYVPLSVPVPPPTDDTNPTAYCEGTHDAFLTLRGAPGWTPEAAIGYGEGAHSLDTTWAFGIRQHEATIASTALLYAGLYDGCVPHVQKLAGSLQGEATIPVDTPGPARFQVVWREDATTLDPNLEALQMALRLPSGRTVGPERHPGGYTVSLASPEGGAHVASLAGLTPLPTPYELRVHACLPTGAALDVARGDGGALRARNTGSLALQVELQDSLRGEHALAAPGAAVHVVRGNLAPKTIVTWGFALAPGEERTLAYALPEGAEPGPARWHAHGPGGEVLVGATEERGSPALGRAT